MRQRRAETGIGGEIEHRPAGAGPGIISSPNEEFEASLPACGGAHGAGLEGHIEGAVIEAPVVENSAGGAQGNEFRVPGGIGQLLTAVTGAGDDLPVSRDDCAHRHFAADPCLLSLLNRFSHESAIGVIKNP